MGPDGGSTASVMAGETVRACKTSSMHWKSSMLASSSAADCGADVEAEWLLSILSALCSSWGSAAFATCIPATNPRYAELRIRVRMPQAVCM
jgi:hypothetical protein